MLYHDRYVLNFGDSWAHGSEAGYSHRYCDIIANYFAATLLDYSEPSTSCARMILQMQDFLSHAYDPRQQYRALFFVTAEQRQLLFRESGAPREMHVNQEPEYYSKFYAARLGQMTLNTTIITLQTMCRRYSIQDHYMLGWQYPVLWPEVDTARFYAGGKINALDIIVDPSSQCAIHKVDPAHPGFVNGHPSRAGHAAVAAAWLPTICHAPIDLHGTAPQDL